MSGRDRQGKMYRRFEIIRFGMVLVSAHTKVFIKKKNITLTLILERCHKLFHFLVHRAICPAGRPKGFRI